MFTERRRSRRVEARQSPAMSCMPNSVVNHDDIDGVFEIGAGVDVSGGVLKGKKVVRDDLAELATA